MPQLFLVRHSEPEMTGVLLGQCDPPLSEVGRAHAPTILESVPLAVVYTSPMRRARETAELIARGAPIVVVADLREITYGIWDGLTWAEIEAADPEFAANKLRDWRKFTPCSGEPWDQFVARVKRAFEPLQAGPRPAAIVAHAGVNEILGACGQEYGDVHEL